MKRYVYKSSDGVKISRTAVIEEEVVIDRNSTIGNRTSVNRSIVGKECRVGNQCQITNSHIWNNVVIEDNVKVDSAIIGSGVTIRSGSVIPRGCILSSGIEIGPNSQLKEFSRIVKVIIREGLDSALHFRFIMFPLFRILMVHPPRKNSRMENSGDQLKVVTKAILFCFLVFKALFLAPLFLQRIISSTIMKSISRKLILLLLLDAVKRKFGKRVLVRRYPFLSMTTKTTKITMNPSTMPFEWMTMIAEELQATTQQNQLSVRLISMKTSIICGTLSSVVTLPN